MGRAVSGWQEQSAGPWSPPGSSVCGSVWGQSCSVPSAPLPHSRAPPCVGRQGVSPLPVPSAVGLTADLSVAGMSAVSLV